jgi:hypothetical protein
MARLEGSTTSTLIKVIDPCATAEPVSARGHGSDVLEVVHRDSEARLSITGMDPRGVTLLKVGGADAGGYSQWRTQDLNSVQILLSGGREHL